MGITEDNWPATVGIITGLLAKEVVVGTLDALYSQIDNPDAQPASSQPEEFHLGQRLYAALITIPHNLNVVLHSLTDPLGFSSVADVDDQQEAAQAQNVDYSTFGAMHRRFDGKIGAFAYLLFILLYFPCAAATGAMYRETGAGWTMLGVSWSTGLAYASAVIFYQAATFSRHPLQSSVWIVSLLLTLALVIVIFKRVGDKKTAPTGTRFKRKLT